MYDPGARDLSGVTFLPGRSLTVTCKPVPGRQTGIVAIDPDIAARAMQHDPQRAGALLAVLGAVDEGDLAADGPAAVAVVHRMEGALLALAAMGEPRSGEAQ